MAADIRLPEAAPRLRFGHFGLLINLEQGLSPLLRGLRGVHHVGKEGGSESLTRSGKKKGFRVKELSKPGTSKGDSLEQLYFRWM